MSESADNAVRAARRRSLVLAGVFVTVVALVAGVAVVLGPRLRSPQQAAADAAPPEPSLLTARAERRALTEPVVIRGVIQPGASVKLVAPHTAVGSGSVVTKVFAKAGSRASEGTVLFERSGEPMFALVLPFPLYRDLAPGLQGTDVVQVQLALRRIGLDASKSGTFDEATAAAVVKLYQNHGYPPPAGRGLSQASVLVLDRADRRVSRVGVHVGDVLEDPKTVLFELDGKAATVEALAARDQQPLLHAGQSATVADDLAGTTAKATVSEVGAQPATADGAQGGFPVRLEFAGTPLDASAGRSVRVTVQVTGEDVEVLAVPVTAVSSRADGTTFVTVVRDGRSTDVTVVVGKIAGGWVEVQDGGTGLAAGDEVVVGERGGAG
ncbi:hypothetical protein [Dactylosporangium sp. CA-139066]|uniref:hypothetical protein n=1 Tax=Dactylosporangium sp. CA-139066 TaxID=3239930 RepID=UPI003D92C462